MSADPRYSLEKKNTMIPECLCSSCTVGKTETWDIRWLCLGVLTIGNGGGTYSRFIRASTSRTTSGLMTEKKK